MFIWVVLYNGDKGWINTSVISKFYQSKGNMYLEFAGRDGENFQVANFDDIQTQLIKLGQMAP